MSEQLVQNTKKTIHYLEITSLTDLNEARCISRVNRLVSISRSLSPCSAVNAFFYKTIGKDYGWNDRRYFSSEQWDEFIAENHVLTRVILFSDIVAGFYELKPHQDGSIELMLFGLLPQFRGIGIGRHALTEALREGLLASSVRRVWLSTCSWDHEHALANYVARGMRVFKVDTLR
jgi:ribosomal protein S18 acetylase RimI-like enzyme